MANLNVTNVKKNIRRSPYQALTASMVMFFAFFIFTVFLILATGSEAILRFYESKPQAIVFFKDNTTDTDVKTIENALNQTGKVTNLKYVSKDQALQIYKDRNKNNPALLELVTANILPASLEISASNPEDLGPISEVLKKEPVVDDVVYPEDVIQSLGNVTRVIRWVGGVVTGFLIIFASMVILIMIGFKIRLKRTEIETMKLLGASTWYIRLPFILEGISYGLIGAGSGWLLSYGLLWYFTPLLQGLVGELHILPVSPLLMLLLLLIDLVVAVLIGGLGSYGAVRRYLRI